MEDPVGNQIMIWRTGGWSSSMNAGSREREREGSGRFWRGFCSDAAV